MALSQQEALRILEQEHRSVRELIGRLSPADFERPATIGGGDWSAKDLLGHLTSWKQHALDGLDAWRRREPAPVQRALRERGLNAVNADAVAAGRGRSPSSVRRQFNQVHRQLVTEIRTLSAATWQAPPTARARRPLGDVLGGIVGGPAGPFAHASAHLPDLEAFVAPVGVGRRARLSSQRKRPGPVSDPRGFPTANGP